MQTQYTIETTLKAPTVIPVRNMKQGQIARIEAGPDNMVGEIIVCNVMGWFTLVTDRYWPSDFAKRGNYVPDFFVRPLGTDETITIKG